MDTQMKQAERDGNWILLSQLLVRAGFTAKIHSDSNAARTQCPHCNAIDTGYGAWDENIGINMWDEVKRIGLPYECKGNLCDATETGCGALFVLLPCHPRRLHAAQIRVAKAKGN